MDFKEQIKQLGERVLKLKSQIRTEEATKTAFVLPFLQCLGYDIFDPSEIVPEFITDIGTKKGEKIDYAIFMGGAPTILIECKHWEANLGDHDGQLLRYFHVSKARFGILTNGINYRFYTDLAEPNKMDEKPFLEFDLSDLKENQIEELKKFHKATFNVESIVSTAYDLKYSSELKSLFRAELANPSGEFVKHFGGKIYKGNITAKVLEHLTILTRTALSQYISDIVTDRLKSALAKEVQQPSAPAVDEIQPDESAKDDTRVVSEEEFHGFYIVKSIVRQRVEASRVVIRPSGNFVSALLDDSKRKRICRLYLSGSRKFIGTFDHSGKELKEELVSLDDIYKFSERLLESTVYLDSGKQSASVEDSASATDIN